MVRVDLKKSAPPRPSGRAKYFFEYLAPIIVRLRPICQVFFLRLLKIICEGLVCLRPSSSATTMYKNDAPNCTIPKTFCQVFF